MQTERPYVLTIAGFDPSSGAGVTADIKTFEQLKVYGLAVCTGLTLQTEDEFISVTWRSLEEVKKEVELLLKKYPVKAVKFGIVPSFSFLDHLVNFIKEYDSNIFIVVDPVWKSSTGFALNESDVVWSENFLKKITLFTPNIPELEFMSKGKEDYLRRVAACSSLLIKGGHKVTNVGTDTLYQNEAITNIKSSAKNIYPKHGSGCVLSAAITAYLALGENLEQACVSAKKYIDRFLTSNKSLLGFHAS